MERRQPHRVPLNGALSIDRDSTADRGTVVAAPSASVPHPDRPAVLDWCDHPAGQTPRVSLRAVRGFVYEPVN